MEVTPGYKQTEVGVIPNDWSVRSVGDVCGFIVPGRNKPRHFNGEIPWVTTPDLKDRRSVSTSRVGLCVTRAEAHTIGSRVVPVGSVVMSCAGDLGITAITRNEIVINQQLHAFIPSPQVNAVFLLNVIASQKPQIARLATKTAVPYLNKNNCNSIHVPVPPVAEQEAIAEALSDADALIESLEQLLAKKRQLKQGALQKLLTGKQRLPGFSGEWETTKVCEFGNDVTGGTPSTKWPAYWGEEFPWVTPTDISGQKDIHATERQLTSKGLAALRALPANCVLVTCIASIGKNAILRRPGACNQQINAVVPTAANDVDFLYYLFEAGKQYLLANAGITATLIISKRDFSELSFCVPKADEQTAIAAILTDMDAEIATLEARLTKTRQLKQGIMQELLTGRIRLV